MTIAQHRGRSHVTGWERVLLVCRVLLAALLISAGSASGSTVSPPPIEYSRGRGDGNGFQSFGQARTAVAPASVAVPAEDRRATFAVAQDSYEFATSGFVPQGAPHAYEAIGPPTTDTSQPA